MRPNPQPRGNDLMRPLGDRRGRIRLEVVGSLWGTLEISRPARVLNISGHGVLVESPIPAAINSTQTIRLVVDGEEVRVDAQVRHVLRVEPSGVEDTHYQIGLEFLEAPPSLALD